MTRNGLGGDGRLERAALSASICRHLGALVDLRMDENDLDCPASALAPLCKLRNLRTLSLGEEQAHGDARRSSARCSRCARSRCTRTSSSSCRRPSACSRRSRRSTCTRTSSRALPHDIGNLTLLQKLDVSENRLSELPVTICELNETCSSRSAATRSRSRPMEQARQGIGAIRRFFGFGGAQTSTRPRTDRERTSRRRTPRARSARARRRRREEAAQSRHDWAGPGSVILLFNCSGVPFQRVDGGSDPSMLPEQTRRWSCSRPSTCSRSASVQRGDARASPGSSASQFSNAWLPWRDQEVAPRARRRRGSHAALDGDWAQGKHSAARSS